MNVGKMIIPGQVRVRTLGHLANLALVLALVAGLFIQAAPAAAVGPIVSEPPAAGHEIVAFPQRDFVSAGGYTASEGPFSVEVIRNGSVVSRATNVQLNSEGLVEVNHPGGGCWEGKTPNIHPGDKVRVTNAAGVADQTTVANVTAQRPQLKGDEIVVHGTAQDGAGNPLPLEQIEQRFINPDLFSNGKRRLQAPGDGTLAYDAPGSINWTATYTGLSEADVQKVLAAETRVLWLGNTPLAATELTIFEIGDGVEGGPQAPCTAPLEPMPAAPTSGDTTAPDAPTAVRANVVRYDGVVLDWTRSTDVGVTGYTIYRNNTKVAVVDGSTATFRDINVPVGDYTYTIDAFDALFNVSAQSTPSPSVTTTLAPPLPEPTSVNSPPATGHELVVFPERDFVSMDGYSCEGSTITDCITVQVIRNGSIVSVSSYLTPDAGFVEVNHPGGGCWETITPDIRPGDVVRVLTLSESTAADGTITTSVLSADQTTVANVVAGRPLQVAPGTVRIRGTAQDSTGNPLPLEQIEQRLINPDLFSNGKRRLQAPGDGTLAYDAPGSINWTATYTGLSQADVDKALASESRMLWLSATPLAATELTIFEIGDGVVGGPQAPCTAPAEGLFVGASPFGGMYSTAQSVTLTASDPTATIYYTTNGDVPTSASAQYSAPININMEGEIVLKFLAVAGTKKSALMTERYLINARPPAVPSTPDLDAASDSGTSNTDNLTNDATPNFSGTAEPGSLVKIFANAVEKGSATAAEDGSYNVTTSALTNGSHSIAAQAFDVFGNASTISAALDITIDTVAPQLTITGKPTNPTNNVSPQFTFSSSETADLQCSLSTGADAYQACRSPQGYGPLADGLYTFKVKGTDAAGNAGAASSYQFRLDATAPTVTAPVQTLVGNVQVGTTDIPVRIAWSGTDTGSGISSYELQRLKNGVVESTQSLTATSVTPNLTPGSSYQFRVRALDKAGNWSGWVAGPSFLVVADQETSTAITYVSSWTQATQTGSYGGSVKHASAAGAKATITFTGKSVEWISTRGADRGIAEVWLDGARVATVDLYNGSQQTRRVVFARDGLSDITHTLEVRVLGSKQGKSKGTRVDVDAFVALR